MKVNKINLNFNYDKGKPKNPTSINKKNQIKDDKNLIPSEIDKKRRNISSGPGPRIDGKKLMDKGKKKFNIINSTKDQVKKEDKNKDMQLKQENQDKIIYINSINEIRLPEQLYDISYDLLHFE
jgi:hypothetical protein